jgi:hypothetical protein
MEAASNRRIPRWRPWAIVALALILMFMPAPQSARAAAGGTAVQSAPVAPPGGKMTSAIDLKGLHYTRTADPDRTVVTDAAGHWLATFTDTAYTVTLLGAQRTFADPNAKHPVITDVWVRILPAPFGGEVDPNWLSQALADKSPDVLAVAMEYVKGAPPLTDEAGLQIAGPATYGPIKADDSREEGGDFSDYLGIDWKFGSHTHHPKTDFFQSLDCSGFMRMVWGYREHLPLGYETDGGASIPRHSWDIMASAPGVVTISDTETQVTDFSRLQTGDLVFFHARKEDHQPQIDHVGMYLGKDTGGHYRFISSRQTIDGPTLGDVGGASLLDGQGLYAKSFRAARRL